MVKLALDHKEGLKQTLDRMLDKGIVIDSSAYLALHEVDLVDLNALTILSSIKSAKQIGLDFPEGTDLDAPGFRDLLAKTPCPLCGKEQRSKDLKEEGCPWCGWNYHPAIGGDKETFEEEREFRFNKKK